MNHEHSEVHSTEQRVDVVIAAFLEAVASGKTPDRQQILAQHPDLAQELAAFFADHDAVQQFAQPGRPAAGAFPQEPPSQPLRDEPTSQPPGAAPAIAETVTLPPRDDSPPAPGTKVRYIGDYELLEELGRGGMGIVYKAQQCSLKRLVALKMILTGEYAGDQELARFHREAEAVARLQHPNIVQIYEIGAHAGHPYFTMEFVPGSSLADKLDGTPWQAKPAAALVETLARAMQAAHEHGVVHRDLKPLNVLLTSEGQPKITDFGLAKRLDMEGGQTQSGAIVGTPSYMAPEQAQGKSKAVRPAADVYTLGAILYELLTGRPPFKAATPLDTVWQVVNEEVVPPKRLNAQVPRDLETICLKCLQKEPGRRYASAGAMAEDLRRFQAGEPIVARPVGSGERLLLWCRRNRAVARLLGTVMLLLVLGTAVASLLAWQAQVVAIIAREEQNRADENAKTMKQEKDRADENADKMRQEKKEADQQRDRAEGLLYASQLGLAQGAWRENNSPVAFYHLERTRPERRGWEYRFLDTLFHHLGQRTFHGHIGYVISVAFSPDGRRLASGGNDGTVKIWDVAKGQEIFSFKRHHPEIHRVCFSSDGRRLAGTNGREVIVWDAEKGQEVFALKGHTDFVGSLCFSPDGRLASGSWDGTVKIWDATKGKEILTFKEHKGPVFAVGFSPDGSRLASTSVASSVFDEHPLPHSEEVTVKIWEGVKGQVLFTLKGPRVDGPGMCFSSDGRRLAYVGLKGTVKVWNVDKAQDILTVEGHFMGTSVCFSPDSRFLGSVGNDRAVKVWDIEKGQEVLTFKGHTDQVWCLCFSPDGRRLASGSSDKTVKIWDTERGQKVLSLKGHVDSLNSVTFSPDGMHLAATEDRMVKIWNAASSQEVFTLKGHRGEVNSVCFSPDGRCLASASEDKTVMVWDVKTGQQVFPFKGHTDQVYSVCYSPDGRRLASASSDKTVKIWNAATGQEILNLKEPKILLYSTGHQEILNFKEPDIRFNTHLCFSPDGRCLAASINTSVVVWDADTGNPALTIPGNPFLDDLPSPPGKQDLVFPGHTGFVYGVCFSPDSRCLASASEDTTVKIWDVATGKLLFTLQGHTGPVCSICYSPDGRRLVSAGHDKTVKVWDPTTGQEILNMEGHTDMVLSVSFSRDGRRLASAGGLEVKIWDAGEH
jgi:WD40 repeat protein